MASSSSYAISTKSSKDQDDSDVEDIMGPLSLNTILILSQFRLFPFNQNRMSKIQRKLFLKQVDAINALDLLKQLQSEVARLRLENKVIIKFFEENDPKALSSVALQPDFKATYKIMQKRLDLTNDDRSISTMKSKMSVLSSRFASSMIKMSSAKSIKPDLATTTVNYATKQGLAEKLYETKRKNVYLITKQTKQEIIVLRAVKEELKMRLTEIRNLKESFLLHFSDDDVVSTEHLKGKFYKFRENFMKNASALVAQSRLIVNTLDKKCNHLMTIINSKSDMRKTLCGADFEMFLIREADLKVTIAQSGKYSKMLKAKIASASANLSEQHRSTKDVYDKHHAMIAHEKTLLSSAEKLKKEIEIYENGNAERRTQIEDLKKELEVWSAPTPRDLIEKKLEVNTIEKEIKVLERKIGILKIQKPKKNNM